MQRITITLDDELLTALDRVISECGYQNRSEALRDLARAGIAQVQEEGDDSPAAVGTLSFVYDHRERELAKRLTGSFHDRHNLSVASMHVHLDHDSCLEVAVLRGATRELRDFAQHVVAERGVRHGRLVTVPVEFQNQSHAHGAGTSPHLHMHVKEAR
jgi:CopG family nickel-responsive transcriptional regulator